jgi:hypothetical protein
MFVVDSYTDNRTQSIKFMINCLTTNIDISINHILTPTNIDLKQANEIVQSEVNCQYTLIPQKSELEIYHESFIQNLGNFAPTVSDVTMPKIIKHKAIIDFSIPRNYAKEFRNLKKKRNNRIIERKKKQSILRKMINLIKSYINRLFRKGSFK